MTTRARKTTAAKTTAAAVGDNGQAAELEQLRAANAQLTAQLAGAHDDAGTSTAELERLAGFLEDSYPTEARTDETPVTVAIRMLDRARAVAPSGVDPASGVALNTGADPAAGQTFREVTLTADDVPNGATLTDVAKSLKVNPTTLLAYNAPVLDAEAQARGLAHSDNGRIIFPGTVVRVPVDDA